VEAPKSGVAVEKMSKGATPAEKVFKDVAPVKKVPKVSFRNLTQIREAGEPIDEAALGRSKTRK
jgi:hypothetical protein